MPGTTNQASDDRPDQAKEITEENVDDLPEVSRQLGEYLLRAQKGGGVEERIKAMREQLKGVPKRGPEGAQPDPTHVQFSEGIAWLIGQLQGAFHLLSERVTDGALEPIEALRIFESTLAEAGTAASVQKTGISGVSALAALAFDPEDPNPIPQETLRKLQRHQQE